MANAFDQFDQPTNPFDQFDQPAGPEHLPGNPFSQFNDIDLAVAKRSYVGNIMDAFGQGFHEGWGEEKLGLSAENRKFLLGHEDTSDYSHPLNPMLTFRDRLMAPLISASEQWDAAWRATFGGAVYRGLQAGAIEAGVPRDIASIPDILPFLHNMPVTIRPPLPSVKSSPIRPPETKIGEVTQPIDTSVARSIAAKTGTPEVDAVLTSPTTQSVIDNAVVDRQYDVPYMAGGSVPMEDPTIYVDRHVPRQQTAPRASGPGTVTFDPADAWIVHENVEQHVMELLTKNGMSDQEAYRVAHFEYAEKAEQAWYRAHDIDQVAAEKEQMSWLPRIQHENPENLPPNLYEKPYPHDSVEAARHEKIGAETIAHSAIKVGGRVFTGATHADAVLKAEDAFKLPTEEFEGLLDEAHDGFITSTGRYVLRGEAMDIAKASGQARSDLPFGTLGSEHLKTMGPVTSELASEGVPITDTPPTPQEIARAREIIADNQEQIASPGQIVYHGSPHKFENFDISKIGTGEGAQSFGHGLYVAEHPDVAAEYAKTVSTRAGGEEASLANQALNRYPDRAAAIKYLRNSEASERRRADIDSWRGEQADKYGRAAQLLEKGYKPPEGNLYQAMLLQPKEAFLDFDKRLPDQTNEHKQIFESLGIDTNRDIALQTAVDDLGAKLINERFEKGLPTEANPQELAANALNEAGIPGIRYLDEKSRGIRTPQEARDLLPEARDDLSKNPDSKQLQIVVAQLERDAAKPEPTSNYVVFNDKDLAITHINGEPLLRVAKDLGIIGEPRPNIAEGKPADAAAASIGGGAGKKPPPPPGGGPPQPPQPPGPPPPQPGANPWRDRFEHFVGKLETPDDVKQLIRNAADEQGEFPAARQGDIKLNHVDDMAQAAGFQPGEIDARGLGRNLKNDAEVRVAMQLMLQLSDNMKDAAREVKADASPENLIKLQESIMRRDLAVEQVVGLRAEWGRTGNVFQEFLRDVKDQDSLSKFLKDTKGRTPDDLKTIADAVDRLDKNGAARFMNDMRNPTAWDKFMWYYVNALISGPITHGKYMLANAAFAAYEAAVVTPLAGAISTIRRAASGNTEGIYLGEAGARMWGIVAGTPDAIVAAAKAFRSGLQTTLPGEIAQNIIPKSKNVFQQQPIGGLAGTVFGVPSRGASFIHSFFNSLGYRTSIEAQTYRMAAAEGLRPTDSAFWERRQNLADAPTKEMMDNAIEEGYRLTFIKELSPAARKISAAMKATKVGQVIMPFTHIPFNLIEAGIEGTPAAFLPVETRASLFGKNGAVKQDMAVARLIAGSAVAAWGANQVLNDRMTGYGPTDPKERAQWLATGHQPYSVRIGDGWYSYNRFGPIGTMLGLQSNLAEVLPHLQPDAEELSKALTMTVHATGRLMEDEVGMQTIAGLISAINDPQREGPRWLANFTGGFLPYSSAMRQTASAMDPEMRQAKTVVDGLRYYIPGMRQQLLPMRDWLGAPITNAGYGGDLPIPGLSSVIQHRSAEASAIASEMQRLDLHPAVPQNKIGSVQLPPQMYDQYQVLAGSLTRASLENWVKLPNWGNLPDFARREIFEKTIKNSREIAGSYMKAWHPEIVIQNVENEVNRIQGVKPTKLKD